MDLNAIVNFQKALNEKTAGATQALAKEVTAAALGQQLLQGLQAAASQPDADLYMTPEAKMALSYMGPNANFQQRALGGTLLGAHNPANFFAKPEKYTRVDVTDEGVKTTTDYLRNAYTTFKKWLGDSTDYTQENLTDIEKIKANASGKTALYSLLEKFITGEYGLEEKRLGEMLKYGANLFTGQGGGGNGAIADLMANDPVTKNIRAMNGNPADLYGYWNTSVNSVTDPLQRNFAAVIQNLMNEFGTGINYDQYQGVYKQNYENMLQTATQIQRLEGLMSEAENEEQAKAYLGEYRRLLEQAGFDSNMISMAIDKLVEKFEREKIYEYGRGLYNAYRAPGTKHSSHISKPTGAHL